MKCRHRQQRTSNCRNGMALLLTLVVLMVAISICITLTHTVLLHQQRVSQRIWKHQADLLAFSVMQEAVLRLQSNPTDILREQLVSLPGTDGMQGQAVVQIAPGANSESQVVTVTADVPHDSRQRCRSTLQTEIMVPIPKSSTGRE